MLKRIGRNCLHGGVGSICFGNQIVARYWTLLVTLVAIWFTIAWFFQGGMIRMVSRARPVTRLEEPALYNALENLCIARGLTMPQLQIIDDPARLSAMLAARGLRIPPRR